MGPAIRTVCIACLSALAFCGVAKAADAAMDSVEGERLDRCVERAVIDFRYDYDHPEQTTTEQAAATLRMRCGREIDAYRAKLTPAEAGEPGTSIVSPTYDDGIGLMFHNLGSAALREHLRPVRPRRGEHVLRKEGHYAGFPSANALAGDEVMIVHRKDAFKYGSEVLWAGTIAGARYSYWYRGATHWNGTVEGVDGSEGGIVCGGGAEPANCIVTLYGVRRWLAPVVEVVGRGSPLRVALMCGPASAYLLYSAGTPPSPIWPDIRELSVTLDDGTLIAFPDKCLGDRDRKLFTQISASRALRGRYIVAPRSTPFTIETTTSALSAAMSLAGHLSALASDSNATERALSIAMRAEETVAPFSLRDTLSFTPEWHGTLDCLVRGARRVPIRAQRARAGVCAHWIESLKWRAAMVELQFPAPPPDGHDPAAERESRRKQSEALVRAEAAMALRSGTALRHPPRFGDADQATAIMGQPGWRGFESASGPAVGYGYTTGNGIADAIVPGSFGHRARNTTVHCEAQGTCVLRLPVGGFATLLVTTDGSIHGSTVCMEDENGSIRDGWSIRGIDKRYSLRQGCVQEDVGTALESIASIYGATLTHERRPSVHWGLDGIRAEMAMGLAEYLANRLGPP